MFWIMQAVGFISIIFTVYAKTLEGKKFRQWDLFGQCVAITASIYLEVYYIVLVEAIYIGTHIYKLYIKKEYS